MEIVEMKKAKASLAKYARLAAKRPVVITVEGRPVAALVAVENADRETVSLSNNPKFLALLERSRSRLKAEGGISGKQMRRRLPRSASRERLFALIDKVQARTRGLPRRDIRGIVREAVAFARRQKRQARA